MDGSMSGPGTSGGTLQERLRERFLATSAKRSPEVAAIHQGGIEAVRAARIAEGALTVGERAPDFSLPDASGHLVHLGALLRTGPAIVTFYRGGWCPYCSMELREYQGLLTEIAAAGVHLVAISPENPDETSSTIERERLAFTVLSDAGNAVAHAFRIVHVVHPEVDALYASNGRDLRAINGPADRSADAPVELPLPATFVIDRARVVRSATVSPDYTERAEPNAVLAVARSLVD